MLQVTEIVRFLLERGLRFRNLGLNCGHGLMRSDLQLECVCTDLPGRTFAKAIRAGTHAREARDGPLWS